MKQRIFTLRQSVEEGMGALKDAGIDDAARDAWYLLEYVTGIGRAAYYGEPDRAISEEEALRYRECIGRRKERIPLQHITGEQEFMGFPFYVNGHVLIPRQDTETLVEEAVKAVRRKTKGADGICLPERKVQVLDMCTGSGCVLLSILKMCPEAEGKGCDISRDALAVAGKNAGRLGVAAQWECSDLFSGFTETGAEYDVIVSNPPYIPTADIEGLQDEVRLYDPRIALDGGEDGLYFYRRIIEDSVSYIKNGGSLLFEIGFDQGKAVSELMESHGYEAVAVKKDLAGLDRVVTGVYTGCGVCAGGFL